VGPRRAGEAGAVTMRARILNFLIALDQLAYVILTLGAGHPHETLSAAAWRTERKNRLLGIAFRPLIDLLFRPLERDHCRKAYEAERRGSQLPKEYAR
jgi:hypothetical protein